jgi:hypothetical protein
MFSSNISVAQSPAVKQATIQALKMAFMTKDLNLSTEEAQKFWPVYNSYIDDLKKIRKESKDDVLAFEEKSLTVKKKYNIEFKKILSTEERANKVFLADRNFAMFIKKELDDRQKQRNMRQGVGELDKNKSGGPQPDK